MDLIFPDSVFPEILYVSSSFVCVCVCVSFIDIVCNTNVEIMRHSYVRYAASACNHKNELSKKEKKKMDFFQL